MRKGIWTGLLAIVAAVGCGGDGYIEVSVAARSQCALRADGGVDCWRDPALEPLAAEAWGLGDYLEEPTSLGLEDIVAIASGGASCAVDSDDEVWCWGAAGPFTPLSRFDIKGECEGYPGTFCAFDEDCEYTHRCIFPYQTEPRAVATLPGPVVGLTRDLCGAQVNARSWHCIGVNGIISAPLNGVVVKQTDAWLLYDDGRVEPVPGTNATGAPARFPGTPRDIVGNGPDQVCALLDDGRVMCGSYWPNIACSCTHGVTNSGEPCDMGLWHTCEHLMTGGPGSHLVDLEIDLCVVGPDGFACRSESHAHRLPDAFVSDARVRETARAVRSYPADARTCAVDGEGEVVCWEWTDGVAFDAGRWPAP